MVGISFIKLKRWVPSTRIQWIYIFHSSNKYILCCCSPFVISATCCTFVFDVLNVHIWFSVTGVPSGFLFCLLIVVMLFLFLFFFLFLLDCFRLSSVSLSPDNSDLEVLLLGNKYIYIYTYLNSRTVKKYHHKEVKNHFTLYSLCIFWEKN